MNKRAILALISGAATTLAFAPFDLFAIALITPAILFILLKNQSVKSSIWLGWLYGLGFFGSGVSWVYVSIHTYGYTHPLLAALLTFVFCGALGLLFAGQVYVYRKFFADRYQLFAFGIIWLLAEWVRSWLFTGFPWLYLGYSTIDTPLAPYAAIGGVWLNSLVVIIISLSLVAILETPKKRQILTSTIIIFTLILGSYLLPKHWTKTSGEVIDITIIQPNIAQETKWDRSYLGQIVHKYYQMTKPELGKNVIIWPETAIPSFYASVAHFFSPLVNEQQRLGGSIITGLPTRVTDNSHPDGIRTHNSIVNLIQGGVYHKQRLVPFGEYVPFQEEFRDLFNLLNIPELSFSIPNDKNQKLLTAGDYQYSTAICYEIAYPELVRQYTKNADVILTLSNDTWFSHSIGPDQHFQIARMRAIENGRWLVRSANNGISGIVDPQGKVTDVAPRYTETVLKSKVQPLQGLTPYQKIGVTPLICLYFFLIAGLLVINRKERNNKAI